MVHVVVLGAAGGIGQPLSLLLAQQLPHGSTLTLYDIVGAAGVAADLSHLDRPGLVVQAVAGNDASSIADHAVNADVIVCTAGVARKPGLTRDDLLAINAGICWDLVSACAAPAVAPNAWYLIITNPVNATVPVAAKAWERQQANNNINNNIRQINNKLLGVSTLDVIRATQFVNQLRWPYTVDRVPVVGGHSDQSIVPLWSQLPGPPLTATQHQQLTQRLQQAGTEVVTAKAGRGSATLSMAYAAARLVHAVVQALQGDGLPLVYAYVASSSKHDEPRFWARPVILGRDGIQQRCPMGPVNESEQKLLVQARKVVQGNIEAGEAFARSKL